MLLDAAALAAIDDDDETGGAVGGGGGGTDFPCITMMTCLILWMPDAEATAGAELAVMLTSAAASMRAVAPAMNRRIAVI